MKNLIGISLLALFSIGLAAKDLKETDFLSNSRQLIYEGARSGEGYFSQDGRYLIFQSERIDDNPFYQIFMLDFETGDINQISNGTGKTTCAFIQNSNNGKVLYSSTHLDPQAKDKQKEEFEIRASSTKRRYAWDYDITMDVFIADFDGQNPKQLTKEEGYDAEASFSPDGKKILFASNRSAYNRELSEKEQKQLEFDPSYFCELYIMDADGSNVKRLTDNPGYDGGPFFSPDGKKVIWRRFTSDGHQADVFTMNLDGTDLRQITSFESMSWAPYFHPSGEYIAFASNKYGYGNFEVFIVDNLGEKEPVRVTNTDRFDGLPVFSPDGDKLVWTSGRTSNGKAQLFMADWNHKAALEALKNAPKRENKKKVTNTGSIKAEEIEAKVRYLSSDELEGRFTGSEGIRLAADFIVSDLEQFDLKPLKGFDNFRIPFEYTSDIEISKSENYISTISSSGKENKLLAGTDFMPLASTDNGQFEEDVIFAGFGIKTTDESDFQMNSYADLDVKDKFVMVLDDMPSNLDEEQQKSLTRYSSRMYKTLTARELGAAGIIFISERTKITKPKDVRMNIKSGMYLAEITESAAGRLLDTDFSKIKDKVDNYNPHEKSSFDPKLKISGNYSVEKVKSSDNNIVGVVYAENSDEYIVMGGHYDHLGYGEGGSLADGESIHNIHNGADDNASGTTVVMELAEYYAQLKKDNPKAIKKNLVFAFWSGEELGLLGSSEFMEQAEDKGLKFHSYLNYDMVGMLTDNKLSMQGAGSAENWRKLIEKKNIIAGFNIGVTDDPYLPTDATSFYKKGVPVIAFFTNLHDNYHRPTDDVENLNIEGMERIAKFSTKIIDEIQSGKTEITYKKVEMAEQTNVRGFAVYLGTIPDYVAEVEGVKLTGVRSGGPADEAGLQAEDIIVHLGDKSIKNIYDYTNVLADLKAGLKYKIDVKRGDEIISLTIIPGSK
ncbi:MAG: M28 family peptidase [Ignavibacteriae bacterium]|nr:M28 family peptidase [Ignavibacteriota bacterium]MCB9221664.1 M28 family peptidase [Ignavibacteria bacterium]